MATITVCDQCGKNIDGDPDNIILIQVSVKNRHVVKSGVYGLSNAECCSLECAELQSQHLFFKEKDDFIHKNTENIQM